MTYAFLKSLGLPINQVSHSDPPVPLSPYPLSFSPHPAPKLSSLYFPSFYTQIYPLSFPLHTLCSPIASFPSLLPAPPFFAFFWDYLWLPLATNTFSHLSTSYWIIFPYPLSPALPIPPIALACPLTHPFLGCNELLRQRQQIFK